MKKCLWAVAFCWVLQVYANSVIGLYDFEDQIEVIRQDPRIVIVHDFLTEKECDHLIRRATPHLQRSKVVSDQMANQSVEQLDYRRTSSGMFLEHPTWDPILRGVEQKIEMLTHIPESHGEAMQILRYSLGGEYRPHYDFFDKNTPGGFACYNRGGQRLASMIIYLSDVEAGGETIFPIARVRIRPVKGDALIFFNCTPDGVEDPRSLHGSTPVLVGEKWVAVKWLREGEFH